MNYYTEQKSKELYYHVTARSFNREFFKVEKSDLWEMSIKELEKLKIRYDLKIIGFVLMGNHFHLILRLPKGNLANVVKSFLKRLRHRIRLLTGVIDRVFEQDFKATLIGTREHLQTVYKYIYLNPVRAGICDQAEDYPFSTIDMYKFRSLIDIKGLNKILPNVMSGPTNYWINLNFRQDESLKIRQALKRSLFHIDMAIISKRA